MLWDLYQQYRIGQLDRRLDRVQDASNQDSAARDAVVRLEEKLDRLALINRAMFELLEESAGMSEQRLSAKVLEIDLRDGQGRRQGHPTAQTLPKVRGDDLAEIRAMPLLRLPGHGRRLVYLSDR